MPTAAVIAIVVAIVALIALALWLVPRRLRSMGVYVYWRTRFGIATVFDTEDAEGRPLRMLNVAGSYQSATYLDDDYCELAVDYDRLYDLVFSCGLPVSNTLMLGGGGYAYPKHLVAYHPDARIDVVEIDPMIEQIARRHFYLDRLIEEYETETTGRLGLYNEDALAYLERYARGIEAGEEACYDAVFNDCFGGKRPAESLATVQAARLVKSCLVEDGVYMTNVVATEGGSGSEFLAQVTESLGQVFAHVYVVPCERQTIEAGPDDRDNLMVIATDGPWEFE